MHPQLKLLLFLAPNILFVATIVGWLLSIFSALSKERLTKTYWLVQVTQTILLGQLRLYWPERPLVSYLPNPLFPFLDSGMLYVHVAFILLPAMVAMALILVARTPSAYILFASGTAYFLLVCIISIFFHGGAVA
jgi:hypothetical protein